MSDSDGSDYDVVYGEEKQDDDGGFVRGGGAPTSRNRFAIGTGGGHGGGGRGMGMGSSMGVVSL